MALTNLVGAFLFDREVQTHHDRENCLKNTESRGRYYGRRNHKQC